MATQCLPVIRTPEELSKVYTLKFYNDLILLQSWKVLSRHFWSRQSWDEIGLKEFLF